MFTFMTLDNNFSSLTSSKTSFEIPFLKLKYNGKFSFSVCKTAIIYDLSQMEKLLRGCTVIEGHLAFTNMLVISDPKELNDTNLSFPELREITDFLLLYLGDQIKTLATIFPNLSVIRGNRLIKVR